VESFFLSFELFLLSFFCELLEFPKLVHSLSHLRYHHDKLIWLLLYRRRHRLESQDVLALLYLLRFEAELSHWSLLAVQR
jgi:hypothetical protein